MSMPHQQWMIYGANGYTGRLIVDEALRQGHEPLLAGRNLEALKSLAQETGLTHVVFSLENPQEIAQQLRGMTLVLNCAGPFSATADKLTEACLLAGVHYLDITGEIDAIVATAAKHERAVQALVSLFPSVGFDVVPSDCLASLLAEHQPDATHLQLAFMDTGGISPGTAKTVLENLPRGGRACIDGRIQRVPLAWKELKIPFADHSRWGMTIPWGDVATASYSTGIPNIEVFLAVPRSAIVWSRRLRLLAPLLKLSWLQRFLRWRIERRIKGPNQQALLASTARFWGRVTNAHGQSVSATMQTPSGYHLTKLTALRAVDHVLAGEAPLGFATPSKAFGNHVIREIPGVEISQIE